MFVRWIMIRRLFPWTCRNRISMLSESSSLMVLQLLRKYIYSYKIFLLSYNLVGIIRHKDTSGENKYNITANSIPNKWLAITSDVDFYGLNRNAAISFKNNFLRWDWRVNVFQWIAFCTSSCLVIWDKTFLDLRRQGNVD